MLAASVPAALRPQAEGIGEVAMGLAAGAGSPVAGVVAAGDIGALSLAGVVGGALVLTVLRREQEPHRSADHLARS